MPARSLAASALQAAIMVLVQASHLGRIQVAIKRHHVLRSMVGKAFVGEPLAVTSGSGTVESPREGAYDALAFVPQRVCKKRSQGENSKRSARRPIRTIASITPMTCSMAFNSRP